MSKEPKPVKLEAEKTYLWCTCGLSDDPVFCNGAHKGTGIKPLSFKVETEQTAYLCTCKKTKNPPNCDGSHND